MVVMVVVVVVVEGSVINIVHCNRNAEVHACMMQYDLFLQVFWSYFLIPLQLLDSCIIFLSCFRMNSLT